EDGGLRCAVVAALDDNGVQFTMACPFGILRLTGISAAAQPDDLGVALVVTVRPGSTTQTEAKHVVGRLCQVLSRF
ncbi:hypothetical protein QBC46DRAFT_224036, partial [Diplogelasinospora grovesii]